MYNAKALANDVFNANGEEVTIINGDVAKEVTAILIDWLADFSIRYNKGFYYIKLNE